MIGKCQVCREGDVNVLLDLGPQPITNRFASRAGENAEVFSAVLAQCPRCGTIQFANPVSAARLTPKVDWIAYREPEQHLDELVQTLAALPGINTRSNLAGISVKDDTTLSRFLKLGFRKTWRIEPTELGIESPSAGIEMIQNRLTPESAADLVRKHGHADMVIARHIAEHAGDFRLFMAALRELVRPDGYLILEIPDASRNLMLKDYTLIWEEHPLYFTAATLRIAVACSGFGIAGEFRYPYSFEDSLLVIAQRNVGSKATTADVPSDGLEQRIALGLDYAAGYSPLTSVLEKKLAAWSKTKGKIALYGAGHLGCSFLNYHRLAPFVSLSIDDAPEKSGLFLPGSDIPIRPGTDLVDSGANLCLLSLPPEIEDKVIARQAEFLRKGGVFLSVFPSSPRWLLSGRSGL